MTDYKTDFVAFCEQMGFQKPSKQQLEIVERIMRGEEFAFTRPRKATAVSFSKALEEYINKQRHAELIILDEADL